MHNSVDSMANSKNPPCYKRGRWFQNYLTYFSTSDNSSETVKLLTAEVFIPGKRAAPASVVKYLYSINARPIQPCLSRQNITSPYGEDKTTSLCPVSQRRP